ncbi:MAG: hypothetical protein HUJ53_07310 [Holdemanella sp.]|nr:hypothetical protein [Holdemanella sp.]
MVNGIEEFKEYFKEYQDCYTVIGGAACDILMNKAQIDFRATKDIDMIILFEGRYQEFVKTFWEYIKEAGYRCGWKNSEQSHFYRFTDPKPGYPIMIELFSRGQGYHFEMDGGIIPVHIDDTISSLSAILLNDDFYNFMLQGRISIDGLSVLSAEYLIPFKMYAWLDLTRRKENGEKVRGSDLKKHKYDVFRLLQIVSIENSIYTEGLVHSSIVSFIQAMEHEDLPLQQIGLNLQKKEGLELLEILYEIKR